MQGEEGAAGPWQGAAAGEEGDNNSLQPPLSTSDPVLNLRQRLAAAAEDGSIMALGQRMRVRVKGLGRDVFAVERGPRP